MNKTVKTIAWICLVLGLMGLAVDVGVYVRGRALVSGYKERIESGDLPAFKNNFGDIDEDGDVDMDDMETWRGDRDGKLGFTGGRRGRDGFDRFGHGSFALPLLLLASGPVLTVIGAVMLIVNREPVDKTESKKKTKTKKS